MKNTFEQLRAQQAQSDAEAARYRLADLRYRNGVASSLDVLDALRVHRFAVAGNSLGGEVAWRMAAMAPDRVAALVLVDAAGQVRFDLHPDLAAAGSRDGGSQRSRPTGRLIQMVGHTRKDHPLAGPGWQHLPNLGFAFRARPRPMNGPRAFQPVQRDNHAFTALQRAKKRLYVGLQDRLIAREEQSGGMQRAHLYPRRSI